MCKGLTQKHCTTYYVLLSGATQHSTDAHEISAIPQDQQHYVAGGAWNELRGTFATGGGSGTAAAAAAPDAGAEFEHWSIETKWNVS